MPSVKRSRKLLQATVSLLVLIAATSLSGCFQNSEVAVQSQERLGSSATLTELRKWVSDEVEAVVQVTGIDDEWQALGAEDEIRWSTSRNELVEGFGRSRCRANPEPPDPAAVDIHLITDPLDQDPFALLEVVRKLWIEEGWEVGTLAEPIEGRKSAKIVARGDNGALMTLSASDEGAGKLLIMAITSPCSSDPSMLL